MKPPMKPPICELCGEGFDPDAGELLEFQRASSDAERHERAEADDFVGHPPNVAWFCEDHSTRARRLTDRTLADALETMRA